MKVRDVMSREVAVCTPWTSLAEVVRLMQERSCGFIPVVDPEGGGLRGIVTDRDVCIAARSAERPIADIGVSRALSPLVFTCVENEDLEAAHGIMRRHKVRRLPVLDAEGRLVGVLSLQDLARQAVERGREDLGQEVVRTLASVEPSPKSASSSRTTTSTQPRPQV